MQMPQRQLPIVKLVTDRKVVTTALKVALVVGTILNIINQGHILMAPDFFREVLWGKLLLTYCVPYLVSSYSSVSTLYQLSQGKKLRGGKY